MKLGFSLCENKFLCKSKHHNFVKVRSCLLAKALVRVKEEWHDAGTSSINQVILTQALSVCSTRLRHLLSVKEA